MDGLDEKSIADTYCLCHTASEITVEFEDEAPYISCALYATESLFSEKLIHINNRAILKICEQKEKQIYFVILPWTVRGSQTTKCVFYTLTVRFNASFTNAQLTFRVESQKLARNIILNIKYKIIQAVMRYATNKIYSNRITWLFPNPWQWEVAIRLGGAWPIVSKHDPVAVFRN